MKISAQVGPQHLPVTLYVASDVTFKKHRAFRDGLAYGKELFGSKDIDDKRDKLHRLITALARSADVSVFKDDDDSDDDDGH